MQPLIFIAFMSGFGVGVSVIVAADYMRGRR
jgi:hypothetical protein